MTHKVLRMPFRNLKLSTVIGLGETFAPGNILVECKITVTDTFG